MRIWMVIDDGASEATVAEIGECHGADYAKLWSKGLSAGRSRWIPLDLEDLEDWSGQGAAPVLEKAIAFLSQSADGVAELGKMRESREAACGYLQALLDACRSHPTARIRVAVPHRIHFL